MVVGFTSNKQLVRFLTMNGGIQGKNGFGMLMDNGFRTVLIIDSFISRFHFDREHIFG